MNLARLRHQLLDMLAPGGGAIPAGLGATDWQALDAMALQHRLRPLLHARFKSIAGVPEDVSQAWRQSHRLAAMEALVADQDLAETTAILEQLGHQPIALKGAWLARHVYPEAAQRPMRDLDLLLERDGVIAAYHALKQAGYSDGKAPEMALEDVLRLDKHMPPLVAPRGTWIELHHRLWEPDGKLDHATPHGDEAGFRARSALGSDGIRYPDPQDMLGHLIVHAVYGHRLDCGPLLLTDLDFLLARYAIDWPRLWQQAQAERWRDGARLVLDLLMQWHPGAPVDFSADQGKPTPAVLLDSLPDLLLQDLDTRRSAGLIAAALKGGPARLLRRLRGRQGAKGQGEVQRDMTHEGGALNWAASRAWRSLSELSRTDVRRQSRQLAALSKWLDR